MMEVHISELAKRPMVWPWVRNGVVISFSFVMLITGEPMLVFYAIEFLLFGTFVIQRINRVLNTFDFVVCVFALPIIWPPYIFYPVPLQDQMPSAIFLWSGLFLLAFSMVSTVEGARRESNLIKIEEEVGERVG